MPTCIISGLLYAYRRPAARHTQIKRQEKGKALIRAPTLMQLDLLTLGWTNKGEHYRP